MISVYLIDDHVVVRRGFKSLLDAEEDMYVVGEADSGEDAYRECLNIKPDVVVTDISMSGEGGLSFARRLLERDPEAKVLVMSMFDDVSYVRRAMEIGAMGFLSKSGNPELLIQAVRAISSGEIWVAPLLAQQMMGKLRTSQGSSEEVLTPREFEVFVLLAEGKEGKEIADILHLSPKTVGTHQTRVFNKLGVKTSAELARLAIRSNLIEA